MAIDWGAYETSGGNGIRVGIDVSWENITHGEAAATATIKIYTQNKLSWNDDQTLNYSGAIGGSQGYHNGAGDGTVVLRDTKSYTYNYGNDEYGSSPGSRTFTAKVTGCFNGITPSNSVTSKIPARPIAAPNDPTNVSVSRVSDTSQKITWTNKSTSGEPWQDVFVDRDINADGSWDNAPLGSLGGGATSFTDSNTVANKKYRYRVMARNSAGPSNHVETGVIYTTPAVPASATRTPGATAPQQVVSWVNEAGYGEYVTEVWVSRAGAAYALLATVAAGATSYTDTAADATQATKYRVRHRTNAGVQGNLWSAWSNETTSTSVTPTNTPPSAPTNLVPNSTSTAKDATTGIPLSWAYHSTDGTAQTKYQVRHRVAGAATWTTAAAVASAGTTWTLPANTYVNGQSVEWQVVTWSTSPTAGPWSASAIFKTGATQVPGTVVTTTPDGDGVPLQLNLETGNIEAPVEPAPPSWTSLVGEIKMWPLSTPPTGYLLCDGQAVSRDTYATLFSVLGTKYGAGDGATTFNLPNFTDRMPRGAAPGSVGGADTRVLTAANLPPHAHGMAHTHSMSHGHLSSGRESGPGPQTNHATLGGGIGTLHEDANFVTDFAGNTGASSAAQTDNGPGASTPVTVTNPYLGISFIIKA